MIYLINYELNNKSKDYSALHEEIKRQGLWWHYLDSTWLIKKSSTTNANTISSALLPYIDQSIDYLFVTKIDPTDHQGWLPPKAWEWINN